MMLVAHVLQRCRQHKKLVDQTLDWTIYFQVALQVGVLEQQSQSLQQKATHYSFLTLRIHIKILRESNHIVVTPHSEEKEASQKTVGKSTATLLSRVRRYMFINSSNKQEEQATWPQIGTYAVHCLIFRKVIKITGLLL